MSNNEAEKRAFVSTVIGTFEENASTLTAAGFDPAARIAIMKEKEAAVINEEAKETQMKSELKAQTELANKALSEAYNNASAAVELAAGLLGKNHPLIGEMRKFRK